MVLKVFLDISIQPERFEILLEYSEKFNMLKKYDIELVNNYNNSDLIIFLVSSQKNLVNLDEDKKYIFDTNKPVIILERQDSSITWVRDLEKIKNLKAIFKNRKLKPKELQNSDKLYYGKYQYYLIHKNFNLNKLISDNAVDIGISHYSKNTKLNEIKELGKIMCILWDFHSSPLCQKLSMNHFRSNEINFRKTIDVFCVNQVKTNNFVNIPRIKAKKIVESLNNYKTITNNLKPNESGLGHAITSMPLSSRFSIQFCNTFFGFGICSRECQKANAFCLEIFLISSEGLSVSIALIFKVFLIKLQQSLDISNPVPI